MIPRDWYCSVDFGAFYFSVFVWKWAMCNWHLLICLVPVNLFSIFGTESSTESAVSRTIFIFNSTLDVKLFKLLCCICEEPRILPNSSWSHMKMCLKYSASLLYPFRVLWSRKTWLFGAFIYHHQFLCHAMVWRSITQHFFFFDFVLTM